MGSRLDQITDWEERARTAGYRTHVLAVGAGVTRQQLNRHFRVRLGAVAHLWIERLRISEALRLKQEGKLIKDIAQELGFRHTTLN